MSRPLPLIFFAAELLLDSKKVYLLCSRDESWAFSESYEERGCELKFVDFPKLSAALRDNFHINAMLSVELNGPFEAHPGASERDVKYWKPQSLGALVFNWWD